MLVIALQPANDNSSLGVSEKPGVVREVLDDPEGQEPSHNRGEALQDKYPGPTRFPADTVHVRDGGLLENRVSFEVPQKPRIPRTASRPPNAPDTEAAEKKRAARMPNSERLYQLEGAEFELQRTIATYHER